MSIFAKIEENKVVNIIKASKDFIDSLKERDPDEIWIEGFLRLKNGVFLDDNGEPKEEQPVGNFRRNTPSIGMTYDQSNDLFYEAQPFPSWNFNQTEFIWEPPIAKPDDDQHYEWNENSLNWVLQPKSTN